MFSAEQKNTAKKLLLTMGNVPAVSAATAISIPTLYKWKKELDNQIEELKQSLAIAKAEDNPQAKENYLRKLLEFFPENSEYEIDLAKSLIKQHNRDFIWKNWQKARQDSRLHEANRRLQAVLAKEPANLMALTFIRIIAYLQHYHMDEIKYLKLILANDPSDQKMKREFSRAKADLQRMNQTRKPRKLPNYDNRRINDTNSFSCDDFAPPIHQLAKNNQTVLYERLIQELDKEWNPEVIAEILSLMLLEDELSIHDRSTIKIMLDKTKSKKATTLFAVKGEAAKLLRKPRM